MKRQGDKRAGLACYLLVLSLLLVAVSCENAGSGISRDKRQTNWDPKIIPPKYEGYRGTVAKVTWKKEGLGRNLEVKVLSTNVDTNEEKETSCKGYLKCLCSLRRRCSIKFDLKAESNFIITIKLFKDNVFIEEHRQSITTGSGVPPAMSGVVTVLQPDEGEGDTTLPIKINAARFNPVHGKIRKYQLMIAADRYLRAPEAKFIKDMIDPQQYKEFSETAAKYRIYPKTDITSADDIFFTFGDENTSPTCSMECTPPLEPDTAYKFNLRLFTASGYRDVTQNTFTTEAKSD